MNSAVSSLRCSPRLLQCSLRLAKSSQSSSQQQQLIASLGQLQQQVALSSTWSHARSLRSARTNQRSGRPLGANGQAVALHVNDLQQQRLSFYPSVAPANSQQLQPPREYESDLIVILDMDECLIHSKFLSTPGNKRPYLDEFLQQVTSRFETHVFTAAMEIYAKPVLDTLDPTGTMFAKRWYRETCSYDATNDVYVKNLHRLLPTPDQHRRVVLVDNNPFSFLANPSNGILVSSFYNDPNDNTLLKVLDILNELHPKEDVRPILDERFGLRQALQQIQQHHQARTAGKTSLTAAATTSTTTMPSSFSWQKPAATLLY